MILSDDSNLDDFENFDLAAAAAEIYDEDYYRAHLKVDDIDFSNGIPFSSGPHSSRRRRRGIIEECCKRPCYKVDLIKYCHIMKTTG